LASGTATVILAAGQNVTCTFTNTNVPEVLRADITPERVNYPPGGTITVKNVGTGPFTVGNIAAVTPPGFSLVSPDGCSGTTLAANATCEFALALVDPGVAPLVSVLTGFVPDGVGGDTKVLLVDP
jgi:hypothetical protein